MVVIVIIIILVKIRRRHHCLVMGLMPIWTKQVGVRLSGGVIPNGENLTDGLVRCLGGKCDAVRFYRVECNGCNPNLMQYRITSDNIKVLSAKVVE